MMIIHIFLFFLHLFSSLKSSGIGNHMESANPNDKGYTLNAVVQGTVGCYSKVPSQSDPNGKGSLHPLPGIVVQLFKENLLRDEHLISTVSNVNGQFILNGSAYDVSKPVDTLYINVAISCDFIRSSDIFEKCDVWATTPYGENSAVKLLVPMRSAVCPPGMSRIYKRTIKQFSKSREAVENMKCSMDIDMSPQNLVIVDFHGRTQLTDFLHLANATLDGFEERRVDICHSTEHKVVIKQASMNDDMKQEAVELALRAVEKSNVPKEIAQYLKTEFDRRYKPTWQCIVGRDFGSFVTETWKIYFSIGELHILLFKTSK